MSYNMMVFLRRGSATAVAVGGYSYYNYVKDSNILYYIAEENALKLEYRPQQIITREILLRCTLRRIEQHERHV